MNSDVVEGAMYVVPEVLRELKKSSGQTYDWYLGMSQLLDLT